MGSEEKGWKGNPPGRAGTFLRLNRDVGRGRLGAALALLAALAVDGVVGLQLSVRLLGAGEGAEDPVPGLPVGAAWIRRPPGAVLQQMGAGAGGLWGCSHLGLAWGENSTLPPRPSLQHSAGGKTHAWSPATAREPGPWADTGWPHGWEEVTLTDAWSKRMEMEKEMQKKRQKREGDRGSRESKG